MDYLLKLIVAFLPAVLLWLYVWKQDVNPEPTPWLVKAVLWGMGISIPVVFMEMFMGLTLPSSLLSGLFGPVVQAFFVAAIPEEAFKLLALWLVLRKNPYFDEHYDGIVYAVSVGLGFAAIENVLCVLGGDDWMHVSITRALLAVPGHYAMAVLMGYYYSVYHFVDQSPKVAFRVFFVPVLFHGIYDSLAMSGMVDPIVGGISFFVLIYFCVKMQKLARAKMLAMIAKDRGNIA